MSTAADSAPHDLFANPMGLCGFEFVEFAAPQARVLREVFQALGFERVARHRSKEVELYRQGGINFLINSEPRSRAGYFADEHGPSACGMAFRVRDAHAAYDRALEMLDPVWKAAYRHPAIKAAIVPAMFLLITMITICYKYTYE